MKSREKLTLVDEYIKTIQILNFFIYIDKNKLAYEENENKIKELIVLGVQLKSIYTRLFETLHMNDISMQILIKDLDSVDYDKFISNINLDEKISDYEIILKNLNERAHEKHREMIAIKQDIDIL